jgi:hypothetical protein
MDCEALVKALRQVADNAARNICGKRCDCICEQGDKEHQATVDIARLAAERLDEVIVRLLEGAEGRVPCAERSNYSMDGVCNVCEFTEAEKDLYLILNGASR